MHLISSVQFSCSVVSDSLQPCGLQHARLPCPLSPLRDSSNSCPLSWWCHSTISFSVVPFSCLQSVLASGSFPMSQFFTSGGRSIGASVSTSVLPMNIQGWFPLGLIVLRPKDTLCYIVYFVAWFFSSDCVSKPNPCWYKRIELISLNFCIVFHHFVCQAIPVLMDICIMPVSSPL